MEIIHVVLGKANPDRMNGVNKVVYQLASRQFASGKKVSVWGITMSPDHDYGERSFTTRLFRAFRNPFKVDPEMIEEFRKVKGTAVVHFHGGWIPIFSILSGYLEKLGIPFVLTPHGAYNQVAMKRSRIRKFFYFSLFEKKLIQRALRIHCIGESEVAGLQRIFPNNKSFLLSYGFDAPPQHSRKVPMHRSFIIGFVGRLDIHTKGLDLLLEAFSRFKGHYPLARIWIIGDGPGRALLGTMIVGNQLDGTVILWGSKFGDDKIQLMTQMDVFVHPSRNEGMPSAVLEASSLGIPCIVSEATNVGKYVREYNAGIVVRNENITDLIEAFKVLYEGKGTEANAAMSEGGRRMVKEVFGWSSILEKFDDLYRLP